MMNSSKLSVFFGALVVVAMIGGTSQAAVVTATILVDDAGPGTFSVALEASAGDNEGIVSYAITLVGAGFDYDHNSPAAGFVSPSGPGVAGPAGFSAFRTPEAGGAGIDFIGPGLFGASQAAVPAAVNLVPGFGLAAGSFAGEGFAVGFPGDEPQAWGSALIVASGTYSGAIPIIDFSESSATVFSVGGFLGPQTLAGIEGAAVVPIPEPATLALGLISLVGIVSLRRRSV